MKRSPAEPKVTRLLAAWVAIMAKVSVWPGLQGPAEEGIRFYDCTIEQVEGEVIDSPVHRAAREPYLYVNKLADRFSNESNYKIIYQPDGMYYSLFALRHG